ncbi:hypothetical protein [Granulicella sibirica]|uniref:Uncharacterized protein n=1 Tax=Granulicella sibirica TaxID=2479048 RepID=A0A4Q0T2K5_9BACT|nr:hypothetical protein [Granulicella sibirica]RXH57843.1 hypothetical protein GRAN_1153 [Granulicella sibirica]
MILPKEIEARNRLLLSYLLSELPQEKIAELDAEMLTQPESLSQFEEGVVDIMDSYADGTLDAASAARLEQLVRMHSSAQKQLSFARALKAARDASGGKTGELRPIGLKSSKQRQAGWPLPWTKVRLITAIAAVLLVLVTGFLLARRGSDQGNVARLDSIASAPVETKKATDTTVFTVILLPTILRGAPARAVLIPAVAKSVRLQAVLPAGLTVTESTLRIANNAGEDVRVFSGLPIQKVDTETYVEVSLPAAEVPTGNYRITLTDAGGKRIAEYRLSRSR